MTFDSRKTLSHLKLSHSLISLLLVKLKKESRWKNAQVRKRKNAFGKLVTLWLTHHWRDVVYVTVNGFFFIKFRKFINMLL